MTLAASSGYHSDAAHLSSPFRWAGYALGFALGGFFDGILLHQVLQWHHLLSGLEEARQDIRFLILTDGLFHLLMYVVAAAGLWLLWRSRKEFALGAADRVLFANTLIGFGGWHVLDGVLSHWVLGIHRIRMDAENPLLWDILWLAGFGIVPLVAGMLMRRSNGSGWSPGSTGATSLVLAVCIAGPIAALPAPADSTVMVVFRPGASSAVAMEGLVASDTRLVWSDASDTVWAVDTTDGGDARVFYKHGALLISNSILPAGCLNWTRL